MLGGLPRQVIGLGARALLAEDRHEGALPAAWSLPGVLPSSWAVPLDVQKVVDDLKGKPKIMGIGRQRRAQGARSPCLK